MEGPLYKVGGTGGSPCPNWVGGTGALLSQGGWGARGVPPSMAVPKAGGGYGGDPAAQIGWGARGFSCLGVRVGGAGVPVSPRGDIGVPQAAEQGHRELCALLLRHRPALAALRDARGRRPRDGAHPAVWDLLDT